MHKCKSIDRHIHTHKPTVHNLLVSRQCNCIEKYWTSIVTNDSINYSIKSWAWEILWRAVFIPLDRHTERHHDQFFHSTKIRHQQHPTKVSSHKTWLFTNRNFHFLPNNNPLHFWSIPFQPIVDGFLIPICVVRIFGFEIVKLQYDHSVLIIAVYTNH